MAGGKEKAGATVLSILVIIYIVNTICSQLFPIFATLAVISFIVTIVLFAYENEFAVYGAIAFVVLVLLALLTYGCGPWFKSTDVGGAIVDSGEAVYEAQNIIDETMKNASKEIIDVAVNATNPDNITRTTVEVSKTLIDLS